MLCQFTYFYTFVQISGSKFKISSTTEIQHFFKSGQLTLNHPSNGPFTEDIKWKKYLGELCIVGVLYSLIHSYIHKSKIG